MCDSYAEEGFLTAIPQSSDRDMQRCIVNSVDFSLKIVFVDWQKCGFSLNISTDLSHYLCLSHWLTSNWSVTTQFTNKALIHRASFSKSIVGMPYTFHPYLMQMASVNSCLFSAYPITLIDKADSQEDASFSFVPYEKNWHLGQFL